MKGNNKSVIATLSVLTIIGLGFYFWKKRKDSLNEADNYNINKLSNPIVGSNNSSLESKPSDIKSNNSDNNETDISICYKCSCTGRIIDINTDEESLNKFKDSCIKKGGMVIEVKNKK